MAGVSDIRNGMVINYKNNLYEIIEFLHVKPGKGPAFVRTKLKNIRTGQVVDNTFRGSDKFDEVRIEASKKQYLYFDGTFYVFMDNENYEQLSVPVDVIGDLKYYLIENIDVKIKTIPGGEIVGIDLPITVEMTIEEAEPNSKGNTASGGGKSAVTNTGLKLTVPFFINIGDKIKVDTRNGQYLERVK